MSSHFLLPSSEVDFLTHFTDEEEPEAREAGGLATPASPLQVRATSAFPLRGRGRVLVPFLPLTPTPARTPTGTEAQAGQATGDPKVVGGQWGAKRKGWVRVGWGRH